MSVALSRRAFLAGAAALPVSLMLPRPVVAAPTLDDVVTAFVEHATWFVDITAEEMMLPDYYDGRGRERHRAMLDEVYAVKEAHGIRAAVRHERHLRRAMFRENVKRHSTPSDYAHLIDLVRSRAA